MAQAEGRPVEDHGGLSQCPPEKADQPPRCNSNAAEATRLKLKGLKARQIIAQGKANLRATPWVHVPKESSPLLLERGEAEESKIALKTSTVVVFMPPQTKLLCLDPSSRNFERDGGSDCANSARSTATTPATGARSNEKSSPLLATRTRSAPGRNNSASSKAPEDWLKFFDLAAVDAGRIPDYVLKDQELVSQLPVFFRTLSGQRHSREDLEKLLEMINRARHP
ncbi:MAG: hypothetical protein IPK15_18720 [Verrucomicrobia bacterium]|nr:hypothetical protein [Verrucomicrobiota bacterium]